MPVQATQSNTMIVVYNITGIGTLKPEISNYEHSSFGALSVFI